MGEWSAYYIPDDAGKFVGKSDEVAEAFWKVGVVLSTENDLMTKRWLDHHRRKTSILTKLKILNRNMEDLPEDRHSFGYSGMGLADLPFEVCVPGNVYDAQCPHCDTEVWTQFVSSFSPTGSANQLDLGDRQIICPSCKSVFSLKDTKAINPGFALTKFYVWVSDIYPEEFEASFKDTVESVLGPCREIIAYDT